MLIFSEITSVLLMVSRRSSPQLTKYIWIYCGSLIIMNEAASFKYLKLMRLRQHLMLLLMKLVSISSVNLPKKNDGDHWGEPRQIFLETLGYLLHPASVLLGSWHPMFPKSHEKSRSGYFKIASSLMFSFVFQLLSNCVIQWVVVEYVEKLVLFNLYDILPNSGAMALHKLIISYFVALQFRTSHYFICFLTESTFLFWNHSGQVCKPGQVELPRSMESVAIAWNTPVHVWLKQFVFKPVKSSCGTFASIILTYAISSFMHGLNFQIWSVLLTLGLIAYLERSLRDKLATIFDSCVRSKGCNRLSPDGSCQHTNRSSPFVFIMNAIFSILTIFHLAYLGSTFDGQEESSFMNNVLSVWQELAFFSHILTLVTFLLTLAL